MFYEKMARLIRPKAIAASADKRDNDSPPLSRLALLLHMPQSCFGGIPPSFSPCRALQKPKQRTGIYTPKSLVYADRTPFFNHDFFASHQVVLDVEYIKTQARYCGKTKCAKTPSSKHMPHGQNNFSLHFSQYFFPIVWQDC